MAFATSTSGLNFPPAPSVDLVEPQSSKDKTLRDLLHRNHEIYGIRIHENLDHHNHTPHILGSAFLLGADEQQLREVYESISSDTTKWTEPPSSITQQNFIEHLGNAEYQKAYCEFFAKSSEHQDWKACALHFLFAGPRPLLNSLMPGLTHPLIHLAYAVEFESKELVIESLGLAATCFDNTHGYLEDEHKPSGTMDPLRILTKMRDDKDLNEAHVDRIHSMKPLFDLAEPVFLEYWTSWSPNMEQLELANKLAVLMIAGPEENDFVFCHALTSYHALRVVLPIIPDEARQSLARQWFLWVIGAYVLQGRPLLDHAMIDGFDVGNRDWKWVEQQALTGKSSKDAHVVKAIRAIKNAAETWGDQDKYYLKAAVRFLAKFNDWTGFGDELPTFERHIA